MKRIQIVRNCALILLLLAFNACKKDDAKAVGAKKDKFAIDSTDITSFYANHPELKEYQKEVLSLYNDQGWKYIWYDKEGRNEFAEVLYDRTSQIEVEGVPAQLPYQKKYEELFSNERKKPEIDKELLITSMYFFYAHKVYAGIDPKKSKQLGWYLPRQKVSYVDYLDELLKDPDLLKKDVDELMPMYYNLRKALNRYRDIRDNGGWDAITLSDGKKSLKKGDTGPAVVALRKRLFLAGDLSRNSASDVFDNELLAGVRAYQEKQNLNVDGIADAAMIKDLNIPVEARIKTIIVNMERCRWLAPDIFKQGEFISVNIPSYMLNYVRNGKSALVSNVVVGKAINRTVVFSGKISYLAFSPYWNVPESILEEEIKPAIEKDPDYLEKHNMEWHEERVRQRPGGDNALGLVKFMFPNQNNIYLHDSPAKSLFNREERAFSHGCVRVQKARELAQMIMKKDQGWSAEQVDEAMSGEEEKSVPLKKKIPVYIAYFTAIADDESGNVRFYEDVYNRDTRLANMLYQESLQ
ncbi:MAG TPA: L,D-transpeptidase family protein [Flavobacterium sp.]